MRLKRYTGSGRVLDARKSELASTLSPEQAAENEMRKTRALSRALGVGQRVAGEYAAKAAQQDRQLDAIDAQQTARSAAAGARRELADIEAAVANDPTLFRANPNYGQEAVARARQEAERRVSQISDPVLRAKATSDVQFAFDEASESLRVYTRQQRQALQISDGQAEIRDAVNNGSIDEARAQLAILQPFLTSEQVSEYVRSIDTAEQNKIAGDIAEQAIVAYNAGVTQGDSALYEAVNAARVAGVPEATLSAAMARAGSARTMAVRDDEARKTAMATAASANYSGLQIGITQGEGLAPGEYIKLASEGSVLGAPGSAEALRRAAQLEGLAQQASSAVTKQSRADLALTQALTRGEIIYKPTAPVQDAAMAHVEQADNPAAALAAVLGAGVVPTDIAQTASQFGLDKSQMTAENFGRLRVLLSRGNLDRLVSTEQVTKPAADALRFVENYLKTPGSTVEAALTAAQSAFFPTPEQKEVAEAFDAISGRADYVNMRERARGDFLASFTDKGIFNFGGISPADQSALAEEDFGTDYDEIYNRTFKAQLGANMPLGEAHATAKAAADASMQNLVTVTGLNGEERLERVPPIFGNGVGASVRVSLLDQLMNNMEGVESPVGIGYAPLDQIDGVDEQIRFSVEEVTIDVDGEQAPGFIINALGVNGVPLREVSEDGTLNTVSFEVSAYEMSRLAGMHDDFVATRELVADLEGELETQQEVLARQQKITYATSATPQARAQRQERIAATEANISRIAGQIASYENVLSRIDPFLSIEGEESPTAPAGTVEVEEVAMDTSREGIIARIRFIAEQEDWPADLAEAHAAVESNFNPEAVSPVGYKGLFQLNERFALVENGYGGGVAFEDKSKSIFDVDENTRTGIRFIKSLVGRFDGNIKHAFEAYNVGPGNYRKYLNGDRELPKETREYLGKIDKYTRRKFGKSVGDYFGG